MIISTLFAELNSVIMNENVAVNNAVIPIRELVEDSWFRTKMARTGRSEANMVVMILLVLLIVGLL